MKAVIIGHLIPGGSVPAGRRAVTVFVKSLVRPAVLILLASLCLSAAAQTGEWTWMGGSNKMTCVKNAGCFAPGSYGTLGVPAPQYTRRYGNYSKYIAPLQQFSLTITFPGTPPTLATTAAGGTGLRLVVFLDGLTDRAVQ